MKGLIRKIAAALMIILTFSIGATPAADLKDGFLGLAWRTDLSASPNFVKIDEQNGVRNYIRPSVIHSIGDIDIFPVIYSSLGTEFFAAYFEKDILIHGRLRNLFNTDFRAKFNRHSDIRFSASNHLNLRSRFTESSQDTEFGSLCHGTALSIGLWALRG